ncbi:hypothetical protein Tco_0485624 [Tanacetum coccineum]
MDLEEDEEDVIRTVQRWIREEETLLCECWVEVSENNEIGADRSDDSFWWQLQKISTKLHIMDRTKNMITCEWNRINGDCQKFNAIYKHLERKSRENEAKHIDIAKIKFIAASNGRKFLLEHVWRVLENNPKWDAMDPLDSDDHTEYSASLSEDLRRKIQAAESVYESKKAKELAYMKCKELEFLMIDTEGLPECKVAIIRKKQEAIMAKYNQE